MLHSVTVEDVAIDIGQTMAVDLDDVELGTVAEGTGIDDLGAGWQRQVRQRLAS